MNYESRLLKGGSFLTRWSHRKRMATILRSLDKKSFGKVADVGCADGNILRLLLEAGVIKSGCGFDVDREGLAQARAASANYPSLSYFHVAELDPAQHKRAFDLVLCLETLEHVKDPAEVLGTAIGLCAPGGTVLVSVPIEVGPSIFFKQLGRWLANARTQQYGYEKYDLSELLACGCFWKIPQSAVVARKTQASLGHKGFDFRDVSRLIRKEAGSSRAVFSPMPPLGSLLNATVFWSFQPHSRAG